MQALSKISLVGIVIVALCAASVADSVLTKERTVTKLAEGVYEIRHPDAPDTFPQGNTTVIIGDRDVLVVDSCYLPSAAREDIAQIHQWTDKPVRYLLNTHWHYDHTMGNRAYADAFPNITIIAQADTRAEMEGYNPGWFARYPGRAQKFQQRLDDGKDADGKPLTDGDRRDLKQAIAGVAVVLEEYKKLVDRLPDATFEHELDLDLGNRPVQIQHLGRGNTRGDAIVYLPKEKILVAGDLLDHPVPYLGGGYPFELITTLKKIGELDVQTIVPGHGDVMHDKAYLNQVIALVEAVTSEVSRQIYIIGNGSRNLDPVTKAVKEKIDIVSWRQKFAGDDKDNQDFFDGFSLNGLITAAYAEVWGR